ncbi:hypothetical protein FNF27_02798 [Cafeteria roenbergensis]|uniref:Uncharacterized protein n=1 Tax=Cafeteria roenbergensis TaxID=33653 RepID=A0A5A8CXK2_CAFRO|nr:hypothetical protein FNF31_05843 [Cafeteria roenbergensis]KAA0170915.1 hypothetical protein FNF28_01188 [Cafeteria roenbergensis]KAA0175712.1 hypothetical protein FNF27_02798 [Cafeteria roenbergensis]
MAGSFIKETITNCSALTEENAIQSIFIYQCSAEGDPTRDVLTATHLAMLLLGVGMAALLFYMPSVLAWGASITWLRACCWWLRACGSDRWSRSSRDALLPRVGGFVALGIARVPNILDRGMQSSLRALYSLVADSKTYPEPDVRVDVHKSSSMGPMRWRDAAARLVVLFLNEAASTPGPARRRPAESVRAYLQRLESDFADPTVAKIAPRPSGARSAEEVTLLIEAASFSEARWSREVYEDLAVALLRFFNVLNSENRRAFVREEQTALARAEASAGDAKAEAAHRTAAGAAGSGFHVAAPSGFARTTVFGGTALGPGADSGSGDERPGARDRWQG